MAGQEYVLLVATYDTPEDALADLRDLTEPGPLADAIGGAGVLTRGLSRSVLQQGGGGTTAFGAGTGAAVGMVVGVVLPLPLVAAAAGAVIGGAVGHHLGRKEVEQLVAVLGDDLPIGSTSLLAVVEADRLADARWAAVRARKTIGRLLDEGPLRRLARSLVRGNPTVTDALGD
jgi:uncharacterized membrane protein